MMLDYALASERGPRKDNEDSVAAWALSETRLAFAVADGLGGHLGGRFASHLAIDMYRAALDPSGQSDLGNVARTIHLALKAEQEKTAQLRGMATTFSAAIIEGKRMDFVHCGDTRIVHQRGRGIRKLTEDHSEAQRLFSTGKLTKEEFVNYPRKNVLESALGASNAPMIDTNTIELMVGDRIFITSDGVHGKLLLRDMKELSDGSQDAATFVGRVVEAVDSRRPDDNFSIVAVFLN
jgi:serine/threonine protein phosphatase PrpC